MVLGQSLRLPSASSICSAEANATILALKLFASSDQILFLGCWDLRVVKPKALSF